MSFSLEELKKNKDEGLLTSKTGSRDLLAVKSKIQITSRDDIHNRLDAMSKRNIATTTNIMMENTSEVIIILDKSGSLEGTESATIRGFSNFIRKLKQFSYPIKITTILFDANHKRVYDNLSVKDVDDFSYCAEGGTALYDTLVEELKDIHKRQTTTGMIPKNTVVITMSDGYDNESNNPLEYAKEVVKDLRKKGWKFIFLGANQDAKEVAACLAMDPILAENYRVSNSGMIANFEAAYLATESILSYGKVNPDWSRPIRENTKLLEASKNEKGRQFLLGGK